ncbi:uncharacterized protein NEMAJ01_2166 [Nematocida major]|uniref:uncharacterized protein n=1 Tax=Nematocida major TaxID=1912982 RepID=UPI0020089E92|nr:uncharacterized protein NEMAJ01_2166 [Nematocida major]KAH9387270.1 hypothetical protein NEMAJ01_2166 [Nematocida major]
MEYLLCGIPADVYGMVKFIRASESEYRIEEVKDVVYDMHRYSVMVSQVGSERVLSIVYPADKSKSRKSLARKRSVSTVHGDAEGLLEEFGCKNRRVREYTRSTYLYKGVRIIVAYKRSCEGAASSEDLSEETGKREAKNAGSENISFPTAGSTPEKRGEGESESALPCSKKNSGRSSLYGASPAYATSQDTLRSDIDLESVLVIACTDLPDGESVLEEVKNKLKIWVDLVVPSESMCEYMV